MIKKETVRSSLHANFEQVSEEAVAEHQVILNRINEALKKWEADELQKENDSRRIHGLKPVKRLRLEHVQRCFENGG